MRQVSFTKEEIIEACNSSPTMAQAAKKLDLPYKILRRLAKEYECFKTNPGGKGVKGEGGGNPKILIQDIFDGQHASYSVNKLRKRLIIEGFKPHTCEKCGLSLWLEQPIPLELHHIDGNPHNHSLSNLQLLCNNCHTLTDNYRGKGRTIPLIEEDIIKMIPQSYSASDCIRRLGKRPQKHYIIKVKALKEQHALMFIDDKQLGENFGYGVCKKCNGPLSSKSKTGLCKLCYSQPTKITWPPKEELEKMVWEMPASKIAKLLNVCDNSIGKKCKQYGIKKPGLGYWAKFYNNKL